MNDFGFTIRAATDADLDGILAVHRAAFGEVEGPALAELVRTMLSDPTAQPLLSLVADHDAQVVGHVLFTSVRVTPDSGTTAQILAPVAVQPACQGRGVGEQLIRQGLRRLATDGVELVFVLGYPAYYNRFGFAPAGARGLEAPYPIAARNADAWMVLALTDDDAVWSEVAPARTRGTVRCCQSLDHPHLWEE